MQQARAFGRLDYGWVIVGGVFLVLFMSSGTRFSFGAFYATLINEFGWSHAALAGAASLNMVLAGLARPAIGVVVDRVGSKPVMIAGLAMAAVSMLVLSFASELWQFYVLFSLMSVGYGAASPSTTVPLVTRWFSRRRATAQSVATAGGPTGELLIVPVITAVLVFADWHTAYRILAAMVAFVVIPIIVAIIREHPPAAAANEASPNRGSHGRLRSDPDAIGMTFSEAIRLPVVWQLAFGFFVCGFTMTFASTHFMAFADDHGIAPVTASLALGFVGGVSILGTILMGFLGDRTSVKDVLALAYLIRGLAFFVLWQMAGVDLLFIGSLLLGLSWGATTPLTSTLVADVCGRRHLGTIFGTMFAIMPIGSGLGAFLAGAVFDLTGSYAPALLLNGVLGMTAAVIVFAARIRPMPMPIVARATS